MKQENRLKKDLSDVLLYMAAKPELFIKINIIQMLTNWKKGKKGDPMEVKFEGVLNFYEGL